MNLADRWVNNSSKILILILIALATNILAQAADAGSTADVTSTTSTSEPTVSSGTRSISRILDRANLNPLNPDHLKPKRTDCQFSNYQNIDNIYDIYNHVLKAFDNLKFQFW